MIQQLEGQMSIFDYLNTIPETFNPLPYVVKKLVPSVGTKRRIVEFFAHNSTKKDRVNYVRKECGGCWGSSYCRFEPKPTYEVNEIQSEPKHIKVHYYEPGKIKGDSIEVTYSYDAITDEIARQIIVGSYYSEAERKRDVLEALSWAVFYNKRDYKNQINTDLRSEFDMMPDGEVWLCNFSVSRNKTAPVKKILNAGEISKQELASFCEKECIICNLEADGKLWTA